VEDDIQRVFQRTAQLSWNTPFHLVSHNSRAIRQDDSLELLGKPTFVF
jgi:hypothetical protein